MNFSVLWQTLDLRWRRNLIMAAGVLAIVAALFGFSNVMRINAGNVNVLANGDFESGFAQIPGCGTVGAHWGCFTNGGSANFGFYDDQWGPVVATGAHSQLIEINTFGRADADHDRVAGIYQTVQVVPHSNYTLSFKGMIRTTELDGDPWRYRVEVGWVQGVSKDWHQVANWTDVGWDTYYPRTEPGNFSQFSKDITATSNQVTLFIRVLKKWGVPEMELDVNLDAIALTGPSPHLYHPPTPAPSTTSVVYVPAPSTTAVVYVPAPAPSTTPVYVPAPGPTPVSVAPTTTAPVLSCGGPELVHNGRFDRGFHQTPYGAVGVSWSPFISGGAANFGFYDDQWAPVVASSGHSQLIEINTYGILVGDPDRHAGIYQVISGLTTGATYELSVAGMLRGVGGGDDPYRFEAQWGYNAGRNLNWQQVTNWQGLDFGPIHPRTAPGSMETDKVTFVAPANEVTLFLRGVKKWGTAETEMDLNLDNISMLRCTTTIIPPQPPVKCVYTVKPGDTLGIIAGRYGVTVHALAAANHIKNPNYIFVGQVLVIPGCAPHPTPTTPPVIHPIPSTTPAPTPTATSPSVIYYKVKPGDTLSGIAAWHKVDLYHLARVNGIVNINHIYVGQMLVIP
jgi:LysM repeat protein